jgi:hypothetical protein
LSNLLKNENSPYLKQHENNPVDWLPWNKQTLKKAKNQKKPIFLSVGYASCHWCHVMAHESFENLDTARIMNDKFINIKVDREERPDLDFIFQKSLTILTGAQGGWPLSMFLDENGIPFTGGTYFPPIESHGRPGFNRVLENVSKVYSENREKIVFQKSQMELVFRELSKKTSVLKQDLEPFVERILTYLDIENGGFKGAPKFPQFYIFETIFYFYCKNKNRKFFTAVEKLLINISSKGIYDHLEGGIARYAVDDKWIVPHFEKMLYDNILYVNLLNQFINKTNDSYLKLKLIQTINFINIEFKSKDNFLGSAYDADSEGIEGKYYIWKFDKLKNLLGKDLELFEKKYAISQNGNFEGSNILVQKQNIDLSTDEKIKIQELENKLLIERKKRIKPFFDDKIQTDLNCYWLYSTLCSSIILNDEKLFETTNKKIDLIKEKLKSKIYHCYDKNGEEIDVFLEDYVYYCLLLITNYEINNNKNSLEICTSLMNEAWDVFYNNENNLLQKNKVKSNDLFVNPIDISDNNIPNGNSIYLLICNKLYNISEDNNWLEKKDILSKSFHASINSNFSQMFSYLKILDVCEENITLTFCGKLSGLGKIKNNVVKNFLDKATIIYKESNNQFFSIICKNQACSKKLNTFDDINKYINDNFL